MSTAQLDRIVKTLLDVAIDLHVDIGDQLKQLKELKRGRKAATHQRANRTEGKNRRRAGGLARRRTAQR